MKLLYKVAVVEDELPFSAVRQRHLTEFATQS